VKPRIAVLVGMVLVAALARLVPHPPNFTPIGAVALFGAAHFKQKWAAFLVPLLALLLSDLALEVTTGLGLYGGWMAHTRGFHTLLGDACFATALFGWFALAEKRYPVLRGTTAHEGELLPRSV
jgi:hypothetical protein